MEPAFDAFDARCPSRDILDGIVGRWPSLVILTLQDNPCRFAEAARAIGGISDRMLSRTLARLVSDGLVVRTDSPRRQVSYRLSPSGEAVATALRQVVDAVYAVAPDVLAARDRDTAAEDSVVGIDLLPRR